MRIVDEFYVYGKWVVFSLPTNFIIFIVVMLAKHRHRKQILLSADYAGRESQSSSSSSGGSSSESSQSDNAEGDTNANSTVIDSSLPDDTPPPNRHSLSICWNNGGAGNMAIASAIRETAKEDAQCSANTRPKPLSSRVPSQTRI